MGRFYSGRSCQFFPRGWQARRDCLPARCGWRAGPQLRVDQAFVFAAELSCESEERERQIPSRNNGRKAQRLASGFVWTPSPMQRRGGLSPPPAPLISKQPTSISPRACFLFLATIIWPLSFIVGVAVMSQDESKPFFDASSIAPGNPAPPATSPSPAPQGGR